MNRMVGNEPDLPYEHMSTGQKKSLRLLRPLDKYHRLGALDSKHFSLSSEAWEAQDQGAGRSGAW